MAFTKEEQRAHRAKRKREREADFALRGVKPQPVGRPLPSRAAATSDPR